MRHVSQRLSCHRKLTGTKTETAEVILLHADRLAAIAYNVEPQLAYQVLLDGPVSAALVDKEPDQIQTLAGAPGSPQVLIGILETQASNWVSIGIQS